MAVRCQEYAASHGCVRMPYGFAEKLFDKTIGMRAIISPNDATSVNFSHTALLVPNAEAIVAAPERAENLAREAAEIAKKCQRDKKIGGESFARRGVFQGRTSQTGKGSRLKLMPSS